MRVLWYLRMSVLVLVSLMTAVAEAQDVRVVRRPAAGVAADEVAVYNRWTVLGALRDDERPSILGCVFPTEEEAVAYARQWLASNHAVNPPTAWTHLKFVVVEGEATGQKRDAASRASESASAFKYPTGQSRVDTLLINLYKSLNKILAADMRNAIKKRDITVQDTFKRVMKAREALTQDVSKLAREDFEKVNALVKDYNDRLDIYSSQEGGEYFARVPRLTPFSDAMIRQALAARPPETEPESTVNATREPQPTEDERPFLGIWTKHDWKYELLPGGVGQYTTSNGDQGPLRWRTYGVATFQHVPDRNGGLDREGTWTGPSVRIWLGEDAEPPADCPLLGFYRLSDDDYDVLTFSNFYDGRSWYTRYR